MEQFVQEKEAELRGQVIPQTKKADFEAFWQVQVAQLRAVPLQVKREKKQTPYEKTFTTWEISYNTHDDTWIDALFTYPTNATGKLPCVVYYHGGSLQKALNLDIAATGVAVFAMDVRGQGGTSIDRAVYHSGDLNGALMTRGVLDREDFYMRNIFLDAVRAVDVAATLPEVDPERIVTAGGSQGGGLSIVASALSGKSKKCYTNEPSFCCIQQRILIGSRIFGSTHEFLKKYPEQTDTVFDVVSYFDVNNMVSLLKVPTLFDLGLADEVCLPRFVYSAYHHASCEKELMIVPFAPHCQPRPYRERVHQEFSEL